MFSYRHSFHAGNHADVLKHLVQLLILQKLTIKAKPAVYIDTHSGAGLYDLDSAEAHKTSEYLSGIAKIQQYTGENQAILTYQNIVNQYMAHQHYPGSPLIARALLREQDRIILMEYHNSEINNLKQNLGKGVAEIHHRDGFEGMLAVCPPTPARGLVLIDPPYEVFDEYHQVVDNMAAVLRKWPNGMFAIWYPLLSERAGKKAGASQNMVHKLAQLPCKSVLNVTFCVEDDTPDAGMYGSGMAIINPPWQLDVELETLLPELHLILADKQLINGYKVEWIKYDSQDN